MGLKLVDREQKSIIYHEDVRGVLFDFIQKKVNQEYRELKRKNSRAFVWVDDPGLELIFTAFSGYNEVHAKADFDQFLEGWEGWSFWNKRRLILL